MKKKDLRLPDCYVGSQFRDASAQLAHYNEIIEQYAAQLAAVDQVLNGATQSVRTPEPRYSGKITTRIAPHVHEQAARLAEEQGISLNQYINDAIVALNSQLLGIKHVAPEVIQASDKLRRQLKAQSNQTASESGTISGTFYYRPPKKGE